MQAENQHASKINSHLRELQAAALIAAASEQEEGFLDQINSLLRELHSDELVVATIDRALQDTDLTADTGVDMNALAHLLDEMAADPFCQSIGHPD